MEMNRGISRKELIANWWKVEGKIELVTGLMVFIILGIFWGNLLVEGILGIAIGVWCLSKIYFRREQWAFLSLAALWTFYQGIHALLGYMKV
ncbi:MAG: hypothetical protein FJZ56_00690 [Chlamydiae bacterium]|nr:hypothetical protein [Chlamydiota bacterium]